MRTREIERVRFGLLEHGITIAEALREGRDWTRQAIELFYHGALLRTYGSDRIADAIMEHYRPVGVDVQYIGDRDMVAYGGTFLVYRTRDVARGWGFGALRVTNLEDEVRYTGAVMVEQLRGVEVPHRKRREALEFCGLDPAKASIGMVLYALIEYGAYDTEDCTVYQLERGGPMRYDGWVAHKRVGYRALIRSVDTTLDRMISEWVC